MNKISGPILDRIDIQIEVQPVKFEKLDSEKVEDSATIKERVNKARKIQIERYKEEGILSNSELRGSLIEKYCKIDEKSKKILKMAFEKMSLSARAYTRILKVSRTIADLAVRENIESIDVIEAIGYRNLDKKFF